MLLSYSFEDYCVVIFRIFQISMSVSELRLYQQHSIILGKCTALKFFSIEYADLCKQILQKTVTYYQYHHICILSMQQFIDFRQIVLSLFSFLYSLIYS